MKPIKENKHEESGFVTERHGKSRNHENDTQQQPTNVGALLNVFNPSEESD